VLPRECFRRALLTAALGLTVGACASSRWPDEPGKPVTVSMMTNVDAGEQFLNALAAARQQRGLSAPIVTPGYQSGIRNFGEDLQAGRTSAPGAQRAIEAWGRVTYQAPVQAWLLDCTGGRTPEVPEALIEAPSAVVSYTAAQFRPASATTDQCAVLVVGRR